MKPVTGKVLYWSYEILPLTGHRRNVDKQKQNYRCIFIALVAIQIGQNEPKSAFTIFVRWNNVISGCHLFFALCISARPIVHTNESTNTPARWKMAQFGDSIKLWKVSERLLLRRDAMEICLVNSRFITLNAVIIGKLLLLYPNPCTNSRPFMAKHNVYSHKLGAVDQLRYKKQKPTHAISATTSGKKGSLHPECTAPNWCECGKRMGRSV